jgi:hypothetical protein
LSCYVVCLVLFDLNELHSPRGYERKDGKILFQHPRIRGMVEDP